MIINSKLRGGYVGGDRFKGKTEGKTKCLGFTIWMHTCTQHNIKSIKSKPNPDF